MSGASTKRRYAWALGEDATNDDPVVGDCGVVGMRPVAGEGDQSGRYRIQVNVARQMAKVLIAVDVDGFEPTLEERANPLTRGIQTLDVRAQQGAKEATQAVVDAGAEQQMETIRHTAEGDDSHSIADCLVFQ